MNTNSKRLKIYLSFVFAWMLMILPLPLGWQSIRPEWITLVLVYWVFREPRLVGVGTAWFVGLIMDALSGVLLGQYALAMAVVAYLAHLLRFRLGLFPFWQQAFGILVLVGCGQFIMLLVQWLIGHPPKSFVYWAPALTSVLVWPWISRLLKSYERSLID